MEKIPDTPQVSHFFGGSDPDRPPLTEKQKEEIEKYVKENLRQARIALINIQQIIGPIDPRYKELDELIHQFEMDITGKPSHLI
jgi:hypothetical protein